MSCESGDLVQLAKIALSLGKPMPCESGDLEQFAGIGLSFRTRVPCVSWDLEQFVNIALSPQGSGGWAGDAIVHRLNAWGSSEGAHNAPIVDAAQLAALMTQQPKLRD